MESARDRQALDLSLLLQLDDLANLQDGNGKRREGGTTDFDVAIEVYRNELLAHQQFLANLHVGRRLAEDDDSAVRAITGDISSLLDAAHVRGLASALPTNDDSELKGKAVDKSAKPATTDGPAAGNRLGYVDGGEVGWDDSPFVESSAWAASRPTEPTPEGETGLVKCDVCWVELSVMDVAYNPCNHKHCRDCLEERVKGAIAGIYPFPLICCGKDIPLSTSFLPAHLMVAYQAKKLEFETPNRTYCHVPTCSKFIPKESIQGDIATCVQCRKGTCVFCKGAKHAGDCPQDEATQEVLSLASRNGCQRCYVCRHVVEITAGCNHITCRCGAQFCYLCGRQWKTCKCPLQLDDLLLGRPTTEVVLNTPSRLFDGGKGQSPGPVVHRNGRIRPPCDHPVWRTISRPGQCSACRRTLGRFIIECVLCGNIQCQSCRPP